MLPRARRIFGVVVARRQVDETIAMSVSKQGKRFAPVANYWSYRQFAISPGAAIVRADFALTLAKKTPRLPGLSTGGRFGGVRDA